MLWIMKEPSMRIIEDALRPFKPNSVLCPISPIFPFVPIEPEHI